MNVISARSRRGARGVAAAVFLLFLSLVTAPALPVRAGNASREAPSYEQRAAAEKTTRSRYRRLEVASLVLILLAGGAAILWVVRRK